METPSRLASSADQPATPLPAASAPAIALGAASELDLLRAELEKERQRNRDLETVLTALQKQQGSTQHAIAELQSKLGRPEQREAGRLVYVLGAFSALLICLLAFLIWRIPRVSSPRWWDGSRQAAPTDIGPETAPRLDSRLPKADPPWLREGPALAPSASGFARDSEIGGLEVTAVPDHALLFAMKEEKAEDSSSTGHTPKLTQLSAEAGFAGGAALDLDLSLLADQPARASRSV